MGHGHVEGRGRGVRCPAGVGREGPLPGHLRRGPGYDKEVSWAATPELIGQRPPGGVGGMEPGQPGQGAVPTAGRWQCGQSPGHASEGVQRPRAWVC